MIRFDRVTFTYPGALTPTLARVDLEIPEGEFCAVLGRTGSGKSTLLRAVNGLVPHFSGGTLAGEVTVDGRSTREWAPRDLADLVGFVGQDPAASFVTDAVEEELAYAMENLGVPPAAMRRRVEDTLDLLGLHEIRDRPLGTLSGGQQQRVAIGAVLAASPRVLVLDEPTSALDPAAAEEVLASLARLVHDLGLTVVVAEHRLERVLPFADRAVLVPGAGAPVVVGAPQAVMASSPVAPPVVELARLAGWDPIPLSVREARRRAGPLRERLRLTGPALPAPAAPATIPAIRSDPAARASRLRVAYGRLVALDELSFSVAPGEVVALMGRNGAGKSTLLRAFAGLGRPASGTVRVEGEDPAGLAPRRRIARVGLVPQDASLLLYRQSVADECAGADRESGLAPGTTAATLDALVPGLPPDRHPRDLSEGQRLALALAVVLAPGPRLLLLDEPTRGLDYPGKEHLVAMVRALAARRHAVVVATHDVELAARVADRAVVLAGGEIVADGPTADVVCASPVFSPQVAKVLSPDPWLTVAQVRSALAGAAR